MMLYQLSLTILLEGRGSRHLPRERCFSLLPQSWNTFSGTRPVSLQLPLVSWLAWAEVSHKHSKLVDGRGSVLLGSSSLS